jgi:hypothetical protein
MRFLMNSQRADLHQVLRENDFDRNDFEIVPSTARAASHESGEQIRLKGTDYYFSIYPNKSEYSNAEKFWVEFSPGNDQIHEYDLCADWNFVCYAFVKYLSFLRREINTSDPWGDADTFSDTLKSLPHTADANAPVSELERKAIWKALGIIQGTLLEHVRGSEEKAEFIGQHFKALHEAATKLGRKDYLMLLYTTIIGIATTMGVSSHSWAELLQPLTQAVGNILKLLR